MGTWFTRTGATSWTTWIAFVATTVPSDINTNATFMRLIFILQYASLSVSQNKISKKIKTHESVMKSSITNITFCPWH